MTRIPNRAKTTPQTTPGSFAPNIHGKTDEVDLAGTGSPDSYKATYRKMGGYKGRGGIWTVVVESHGAGPFTGDAVTVTRKDGTTTTVTLGQVVKVLEHRAVSPWAAEYDVRQFEVVRDGTADSL